MERQKPRLAWCIRVFAVLSTLAALAIAPESLRAQVTASIVGTVTDQSGAVVSGATISVKSMDTGAMREVTTDDLGYYRVLSLPLGHQVLTAEKAPFTKYVLDGIELVVGQVAVVNPTLRVASGEVQINVSAQMPIVNTTPASVSGIVDQRADQGSSAQWAQL